MKVVLICPGERPAVGFLAAIMPLVNLPLFGESLLGHWLEYVARRGFCEATVLATDRPERVEEEAGGGVRWGMHVRVAPTLAEPAVEEVRKAGEGAAVFLMDHLPEFPEHPLFQSYGGWFGALLAWMNCLRRATRLGVREIRPGIWAGLRSQVAESVRLKAPAWIGEQVRVGAEAVVGPEAILENRVVVEGAAEITRSVVGPETVVGKLTRLDHSMAYGSTLVNWRTGSCTVVPDAFLLCGLGQATASAGERPWRGGWWEHFREAVVKPVGGWLGRGRVGGS